MTQEESFIELKKYNDDVIHEWVEGAEIEYKSYAANDWKTLPPDSNWKTNETT